MIAVACTYIENKFGTKQQEINIYEFWSNDHRAVVGGLMFQSKEIIKL